MNYQVSQRNDTLLVGQLIRIMKLDKLESNSNDIADRQSIVSAYFMKDNQVFRSDKLVIDYARLSSTDINKVIEQFKTSLQELEQESKFPYHFWGEVRSLAICALNGSDEAKDILNNLSDYLELQHLDRFAMMEDYQTVTAYDQIPMYKELLNLVNLDRSQLQ